MCSPQEQVNGTLGRPVTAHADSHTKLHTDSAGGAQVVDEAPKPSSTSPGLAVPSEPLLCPPALGPAIFLFDRWKGDTRPCLAETLTGGLGGDVLASAERQGGEGRGPGSAMQSRGAGEAMLPAGHLGAGVHGRGGAPECRGSDHQRAALIPRLPGLQAHPGQRRRN